MMHFGCSLCSCADQPCKWPRKVAIWAATSCFERFGAGLSGCSTTWLLQESSLRVALSEPSRPRFRRVAL